MPASKSTPAPKKAAKTAKKKSGVVEAAPEVVAKAPAVKPVKKVAAKKAKPAVAEAAAPEVIVKPKRATKPKKDKGRDLVVDEPGAAEVAAVLHHEEPAAESTEASEETAAFKGPEPKLERLQKILAKAGISSRRKAEELILGGQVQINGKVVMELGTKADPARDHIRVDGKLLQGAERLRYFVLNKPKGYVTTVSDPEGRPTVMGFFAAERERLYPVGRLDYLSEGLLLVTNDGDLANKLTKAASGVEKTYLVKVAGQPTEDMLDVLRGGVVIEKGRPGNFQGRVRTAPAKIRQVRQGDNPWYEVIIIEGRNRELRKMFEEIGHHVEKIRRIGYGPLILDLEPGKLRELEPEEVRSLHLAAEGKLKTRRRRGPQEAQLPTVAGKTVRHKKADGKPGYEPRSRTPFKPAVRPEFQVESPADPRPEGLKGLKRIPKAEFHAGDRPAFKARPKPEFRPQGKADFKGDFKPRPKPTFKPEGKPAFRSESKFEGKPSFQSGPRPASAPGFKPGFKSASRPTFGDRPAAPPRTRRPEPPVTEFVLPPRKNRPEDDDQQPPAFNPDYKPGFRTGDKPAGKFAGRPPARPSSRPDARPDARGGGRPRAERHPFPLAQDDDYVPTKTPGFKVEPVEDKPRSGGFDRSGSGNFDRPRPSRTGGPSGPRNFDRPGGGKPFRPAGDRPFRPREDAPAGEARTFRPRPASGGANSSGDRPAFNRNAGRPAGGPKSFGDRPRPSRPSGPGAKPFRPAGPRPTSDDRPKRFESNTDSPRSERPREFRPSSAPKKFAGAKPAAAGPRKTGPDGEPRSEPRIKERWRNSFTGKNKGRPKPKPKGE